MLGEKAKIPDPLGDLVSSALDGGEEAPKALLEDLLVDRAVIDAGAGLEKCAFVDIAREDLRANPALFLFQEFKKRDRERIGLLPDGAPGHPEADRGIGGTVLQKFGEHRVLERLKALRIPEERGDVDEDVVMEGLNFLAIGLQVFPIVLEMFEPADGHPTADSTPDRVGLVPCEGDARLSLEEVENLSEFILHLGRDDGLLWSSIR